MANGMDVHELLDGDIRVWINEGGAISLIVRDKHGDPVELNEDEAEGLVNVLVDLIRKCRG